MSVLGLGNLLGLGGSLLNQNPSPFAFSERRGLHYKSFIEFVFPTDTPLVAKLPFYENIEIKESKKANLVSYDTVGRNSSLYTYTGASSRSLKLSFSLSLPHIQAMHGGSKVRFKPGTHPQQTKEQIKKIMMRGDTDTQSQPESEPAGPAQKPAGPAQKGGEPQKKPKIAKVGSEPTNWVKYVSWWVNLIRTSVMSNQLNTMEGPPIIRLTHGSLYQNVPCVCKSYNISYDKTAGMDVQSLLSRRILVEMDLEEFRAGNFGDFKRTSKIMADRDNVAGWEAIIQYSTTDPGREAIEVSYTGLDIRMPDAPPPDTGATV